MGGEFGLDVKSQNKFSTDTFINESGHRVVKDTISTGVRFEIFRAKSGSTKGSLSLLQTVAEVSRVNTAGANSGEGKFGFNILAGDIESNRKFNFGIFNLESKASLTGQLGAVPSGNTIDPSSSAISFGGTKGVISTKLSVNIAPIVDYLPDSAIRYLINRK